MLARWMILLISGVFLIVFESSSATSTQLHSWEHEGSVLSVAYSPDGKAILTGSDDNTARLYDTKTGDLIHSWEHEGSVRSVAYSPDGKTILTGSGGIFRDSSAQLYDIQTRDLIHSWQHEDGVNSVVYSPDGKTILTGSAAGKEGEYYGYVRLYDIQTRELIHSWQHSKWVRSVAYSPDGKIILTASIDRTARLYDTKTGDLIKRWRHGNIVLSVAYSPDGETILTGSSNLFGTSGEAQLYDIQTGDLIHSWEHDGVIWSVAYAPDGETILTGSSNLSGTSREAQLYDIQTGDLIHSWEHDRVIWSVAYSPDGKTILTGSTDGFARLFEIPPSDSQTQTHKQLVIEIQQGLHDLGYNPGVIDGIEGPRTNSAIRMFEQDHELPITGRVSPTLKTYIVDIRASRQNPEIPSSIEMSSTGSGFFISPEGHLITNHHVVNGCTEVRLADGTKLERIAHNEQDDLALYQDQSKAEEHSFVYFRAGRGIRPEEDIVILGFPLSSSLSSSLKATTGIVSSLLGPEDDRSLFQFTASVNPGNSGGPVLDNTGQVVGIVVPRITDIDDEPTQRLNFAIHSGIVRLFLDVHSIPYEINLSPDPIETADIVTQGQNYTVLLECWK